MRLVCGGVGTEVEVEGMATAAWVDRLRSPAWERGLVFLGGSAGAGSWGRALPVGGSSGGGRKAAVPLGGDAWCSTLTLASTSAGQLLAFPGGG